MVFFISIEEINRLISQGISNVYLRATIEKNWRFQNIHILSKKTRLQVSFWGAPANAGIIDF